ncbi:MAG: CoA pyrophosphatase [Hyphomicrobium sp.]|nr:CoA pyrophosphatase [Hyphomicrobium sp.]
MTSTDDQFAVGLTADGFRLRARNLFPLPDQFPASNPAPKPPKPSDFDLNPDALAAWRRHEPGRPAAVLVPVMQRPRLTILLTERTPHLKAHAGQIAFPGGKPEPGDPDPAFTALREAHEEIGLDPRLVEPLGTLATYTTGTGFAVVPVVALVTPPDAWRPDPEEVADVFEVPLDFLMRPENHRVDVRAIAGRGRNFYAMPYGERYIWGATAGMLKHMQELMFPT